VKVAADSSPLIALAKINEFQLVQQLFEEIWISSEVFSEIAVVGRGRAGSQETRSAPWIKTRRVEKPVDLLALRLR
jgi:predicted nucleic acid-binding protein